MKNFDRDYAVAGPGMTAVRHEQTAGWTRQESERLAPVGGHAKRIFDISVALTMLVLLAPLILGLAILVAKTSPGGVFYGHSRVGYGNKPFKCFKFRTMVPNGDQILQNHLLTSPAAKWEWDTTQKLREDPRITPVGQVLRKLSLDELPQLYNVLRGDMSLVGPRPVTLDEFQRYGRSGRYYLRARPGITGLWQVSGRSTTTYTRRVAYDRTYVSRFGMGSDLIILTKTLPAALRSNETS